jgi:putative inorganic carbon (HCO3(-)) transporter
LRSVRSSAQGALVTVLVGCGLVLALVLVVMVGQGQAARAYLTTLGLAALLAACVSLDLGVAILLILSFLDGFIKGLDPSKFSVFAKDIFLAIALARWGWSNLLRRHWPALRMPVTVPAVLFIVYCIMQIFNTATVDWRVALAGLRTWIVWIPVAYVVYEVARNRANVRRIMLIVIVMGFLTGLYAMIQYRVGFEHLNVLGPGFDFYARRFGAPGQTVRATSTFVSPGALGAAMSLVVVVALAGTVFLSNRALKIFAGVTAAICLVGLGASASRAPLLGLVAGGVTLLVLMRKPRLLAALLLSAVLFLWLVSTFAGGSFARRYNREMLNPEGMLKRVLIPWEFGWESLAAHPLGVGVATGVGIGRGAQALGRPAMRVGEAGGFVENEYGRALHDLGLPGLVLFLWMLYRVLAGNIRSYRACRTTRYRAVAAACLSVTISIIFQLTVGSALYLAPGGLLFWAFYAISQRLPELEAAELAPLVRPPALPRVQSVPAP